MLILLPALLVAAAGSTTPCATGTWALDAGGQTLFRFEIKTTPVATTAVWERPTHFEIDGESSGESFLKVNGPVVRRSAKSVNMVNGDIEISFDDPMPESTPDIFRLHCVDTGHLVATYKGTPFEPFELVRARPRTALGPWDSNRAYVRTIVRPTNAEMTAIFDKDQTDRQPEHIDWTIVGPADKKRQRRTQQLLDSGAIQSGNDYYHAAFVFQHGSTAADYLKAHLLAVIAAARGKSEAVWIASATLDRYLQAIGKPQVLGTQYKIPNEGYATQEPYDRALVSDTMRKALHVPPLSDQERQREQYSVKATDHK